MTITRGSIGQVLAIIVLILVIVLAVIGKLELLPAVLMGLLALAVLL
jgi:hypothetical protein